MKQTFIVVSDPPKPKLGKRLRVHREGCSRRMKTKWSGKSCDCGARWVCL